MSRICVIALVGLPSSGKTSFCRTVLRSSIDFNFVHVCYDDYFTFLPQIGSKTFKEERAVVLQKVDRIATDIITSGRPLEGTSHWKKSSSDVFVVLCDDNHYYAGMRYDLYKICRKHCLSFGQIYFPLVLDIALMRNSARTQCFLPPEVVVKMSERLEAPSTKNQWERNSLRVEGDIDMPAFISFLKMCLQNPAQPLPEIEKPREKDLNAIHGLDLLLRGKIRETLQNEGGDLSERAKHLNGRRKSILREVKKRDDGELDVDYLLKKLFLE